MTPEGIAEWPILVASGMAGAAHCLGMCGPLTALLGAAAPTWRINLRRQLAYSAGRVFTYAVLGAVAAFAAARLACSLPAWANVPASLAIAAGLLLVWQGLLATGLVRSRGVAGAAACPGGAAFRGLLASRGLIDAFVAGLFTGLMPCGLLYGMLTYAASRHDVVEGMATMAAFGAGTVPALVAVGIGGGLLTGTGRRRLQGVAAWCLLATGVVALARGSSYLSLPGREPAGCPFCAAVDSDLLRPVP